ncbi:Lrp/AsnC family transcriptional regulator [Candidatus Woesearchaeota archaeon]|nr:Lrp/AsnC family transcriptional regulator [Candidatus Woesearchaeota archaeon]
MDKLDKIDRKILYELDKNSRGTDSKIAKKVHLSVPAVKYRIERLVKKGIIANFVTLINPAKFGKMIYKIYLRLQEASESVQDEIADYFIRKKKTFWVIKCDGAWDIITAVWVKDAVEFHDFFMEFSTKYNKYIIEKQITNQIEVLFFNRAYFTNSPGSEKCLWGGKLSEEKLDPLDMKILKLLPTNARMPVTEIARRVKSTPRSVSYRIKDLVRRKIILEFSVQLDVNKFNYDYYKSIIYLKNMTHEREMAFIEYCKQLGKILYFIKTIGPWELELEMEVRDYKEYNHVMKDLRKNFGDIIRNHETVLIVEEFKGEYNSLQ